VVTDLTSQRDKDIFFVQTFSLLSIDVEIQVMRVAYLHNDFKIQCILFHIPWNKI